MTTTSQTEAAPATTGQPLQLKKVLVPVDFSECSHKAMQYAVAFAKQFKASLTLVHVVQMSYAGAEFAPLDFPLIEKQMVESSSLKLAEIISKEIGEAVPCDMIVKAGHPATEIALAAKKVNADLIIISTHGYTGLKHILLGSTAENVVRHAPCPVLTVREHEHEFINT